MLGMLTLYEAVGHEESLDVVRAARRLEEHGGGDDHLRVLPARRPW